MSKPRKKLKADLNRRDFGLIAGVAAGSAVFAQLVTTGPLSPFGALKQRQLSEDDYEHKDVEEYHWGMVIDLNKCIGCEYCQRTCNATNNVSPGKPWNIVVEDESNAGQIFYFSRPCLHCQHAPCVEVCPVQATYVRDDGLVMMDYDRCIGCRYCEVACPFDARKFNWEEWEGENEYVPTWGIPEVPRRSRGVVEKCTFCVQRIDYGYEHGLTPGEDYDATPACVNICPVEARVFGNLHDPESNVSKYLDTFTTVQLRDELGTDASVYYIPPGEET